MARATTKRASAPKAAKAAKTAKSPKATPAKKAVAKKDVKKAAPAKKPAASKRRSWSKDDVKELKALAKQKLPTAKIAKALKRTEGATRQKAYSLGVSLDSRR